MSANDNYKKQIADNDRYAIVAENATLHALLQKHDAHWHEVAQHIGAYGGYGGCDGHPAEKHGTAQCVVDAIKRLAKKLEVLQKKYDHCQEESSRLIGERDEWEAKANEYCQDVAMREIENHSLKTKISNMTTADSQKKDCPTFPHTHEIDCKGREVK